MHPNRWIAGCFAARAFPASVPYMDLCHANKKRAHTAFRSTMSPRPWIVRIGAVIGLVRAAIHAFVPGRVRGQRCLRASNELIASHAVSTSLVDAARAEACVAELEKLAARYSTQAPAHFPSTRARMELLGSRVRKAQLHAQRARAHADTAVVILRGRSDARFDSTFGRLMHHADLAKQSRLLAVDLLEISLASDRRKKSRDRVVPMRRNGNR